MIIEGHSLVLDELDSSYTEPLCKASSVSFRELKDVKPGLVHPLSLNEQRLEVERTLQQMHDHQLFAFVMLEKSSSNLVGYISTYVVDWPNQNTEIGYWVATPFTGKGCASEAIVLMLWFLFNECRLHRVCATAPSDHQQSRHILEKLQFSLEGELAEARLINHRWQTISLYAMLAKMYKRYHAAYVQTLLNGNYPKIKI